MRLTGKKITNKRKLNKKLIYLPDVRTELTLRSEWIGLFARQNIYPFAITLFATEITLLMSKRIMNTFFFFLLVFFSVGGVGVRGVTHSPQIGVDGRLKVKSISMFFEDVF